MEKGDTLKAKIVEISVKDEKVRLSARVLQLDPFDFFKDKQPDQICSFIVHESLSNGIIVTTGPKGMKLLIKKNNLAIDKSAQRTNVYSRGNVIDALIVSLNKKSRKVEISIKALEEKLNSEAIKNFGSKDAGASLASVLGAALKNKKK